MLKELILDVKVVTCLRHALHNLCESIRNDSTNGNQIVAFLKRTLIENKKKTSML